MEITILLLTKNVLAETSLPDKLQRLNYEVFCSSRILTKLKTEEPLGNFLDLFHYTIISETVSDVELKQVLPRLKQSSTVIIRKCDHKDESPERDSWYEQGVRYWVSNDSSFEELREIMIDSVLEMNDAEILEANQEWKEQRLTLLIQEAENGKKRSMSTIPLKPVERAILDRLYQSKGELVSREEMCKHLWNGESNNSTMVSLSSSINGMRRKFQQEGLPADTVQTVWRKGYRLADYFFLIYSSDAEICEDARQVGRFKVLTNPT
ncbi:helix-turn-helix domain-containing protein [Enterococcus sp. 669A]|uniref:Helix-turn-helix domain-containing protein n=1 Tax=Candidatus Enterococcus moelleringii TaxID=2815325 RepID=A0ABS3LCK8_9ENTE|nr:helix-turn-helix domain-containing protein [Enterococcus sp. 669A]MBO1306466.1 helix-turn-helix domain-containing protein [Enterococcus sp. 669A]